MRRLIGFAAYLLTSMAAAAAPDDFITVKGEATAKLPPDFVSIDVTIAATGPDTARLKQQVD